MAYSKIASFIVRLDEFSDPIPLMATIGTNSGVDLPYEIYEKGTANLAVSDNLVDNEPIDLAASGYIGSGGASEFDFYVDTTRLSDLRQIEIDAMGGAGDKSSLQSITLAGYTLTNLLNVTAREHTDLTTITGLNAGVVLTDIIISNNNMTAEQVNAIVDDVFEMAVTNNISDGTLNITGNAAPTGDSLLAYNALVSFGWNSGTPITDISNRFELEAIGLLLSGNYTQTANIDLDGAGAVWKDSGETVVSAPVPNGSLDISACNNWYDDAVVKGIFTGSFDGNGYHIYNLAIQQQIVVKKYCGLFERGSGCQITNLTVSGNMQANGESGSGYSGGLIGYITGSTSFANNCVSNVNCLSGSRVGGFVGYSTVSATITDCYSTGDVASGGFYAGGFVGATNSSTITNCYSTGDVASSGSYAGGFGGSNNHSSTITNCYSTGNVASSDSSAGGFVGWNQSATITTSFCYGEVTGTSGSKAGFTGRNTTSDILDCYYRSDYYAEDFPAIYTDETGTENTVRLTGLTEEEFINQDKMNNLNWLDFELINNTYPTLKWESNPDYDRLKISDIYELQSIIYNLSGSYRLVNDIDASITATWNDGAGFVPIGTSAAPFVGTLNGNGFVVDGLYIRRNVSYTALVGLLSGSGTIRNLGLTNVDISGTSGESFAGICGHNGSGTIEQCFVTGNIYRKDFRTGSICGDNRGIIRNCWATATITGGYSNYIAGGGIAGQNYKSSTIITNCHYYNDTRQAIGAFSGGAIQDAVYQLDRPTSQQGVISLTAAEFRNKANFTGFDFDDVWVMGRLHPMLRAFFGGINPLYENGLNDLSRVNDLYNHNDLYAYNRLYDE
jgi:hypothetical protein